MKKLGIEYRIFEDNGNGREQVLGYRYAPGNLESGLKLMTDKLSNGDKGIEDLSTAARENARRIMRGTINEK